MTLPSPNTALYSHPLPDIEKWLRSQGCTQDEKQLHYWYLNKESWQAEHYLDIEQIVVTYIEAGDEGEDIQRAFKYSLTRQDIEQAIFSGP